LNNQFILIFNIFSLLVINIVAAQSLPDNDQFIEEQIYHRCYRQFVRQVPDAADVRLGMIQQKQLTGVAACKQLIKNVSFKKNGQTLPAASIESELLQTFHLLHHSWFKFVDFFSLGMVRYQGTYQIYDNEEMALHITHALFGMDESNRPVKVDKVLTSAESLMAVRQIQGEMGDRQNFSLIAELPIVANNNIKVKNLKFATGTPENRQNGNRRNGGYQTFNPRLIPRGELIGVQSLTPVNLPQLPGGRDYQQDIALSFGGGILGTRSYLALNLGLEVNERATGGIEMPRRWSESIVSDFMCRDLPVLKSEDIKELVQTFEESELPFRQGAKCMQCHATMDPLAALARNLVLKQTVAINMPNGFQNLLFIDPLPSILTAESNLLASGKVFKNDFSQDILLLNNDQPAFANTAPWGVFHYRPLMSDDPDIKKQIQNQGGDVDVIKRPVKNFNELGLQISRQIDFYACFAKRYYAFLTGIEVQLSSLNKNTKNGNDDPVNFVIDLALQLQKDKDLKNLLYQIIEHPTYTRSLKVSDR
jgi:hypothetical protein